MAHPKNRGAPQSGVCTFPKCDRSRYSRDYCQTHSRQFLTTGKLKPVRHYRPRTPGTVKFAGLRLSPECAARLDELAEQRGHSVGATIADVLERAVVKRRKPTAARQRKDRGQRFAE